MEGSSPLRITCKPLGSIVIPGPVVIQDVDGNELPLPPRKDPSVVKLCGCGRSGNRPFCDGSHKRVPSPASLQPEP